MNVSERLEREMILGALSPRARSFVARLDLVASIASTNTALMERSIAAAGTTEVLLAELQTSGRGRRGRAWLASPGGSICLSLNWTFPQLPHDVSALSLAVGVWVLRALESHGVDEALVKWPNDILLNGKKLGGILIELRSEPRVPAGVVIGIGMNTAFGNEVLERVTNTGVAATDLVASGHGEISRNALAATLIERCIEGLNEFQKDGLRPFIDEWTRADALHGQQISVQSMNGEVLGIERGIDLSGALVVETPQGLKKFVSGEVTVRSLS